MRLARRSSSLHLSRFLHSGLQGGRQSKHTDHPCSGRYGEWRRNSRPLHGLTHRSWQRKDRVTGVHYFDRDGKAHFQKAKAVIVSGYAIETPRLLLNSACPGYENGLANSSGTVGRYLMAQAGNVILGRFDEPVRMYKAPPAHALDRRILRDGSASAISRAASRSRPWVRCRSRSPSR